MAMSTVHAGHDIFVSNRVLLYRPRLFVSNHAVCCRTGLFVWMSVIIRLQTYGTCGVHVHFCSKVMGFFFCGGKIWCLFLRYKLEILCGIRRSFAFTMEHILSVWYTATPGWTSNLVRFEKRAVKTLQHGQIYGDVFLFHEMTNTYEWWSAIIDTNHIFVANYYAFLVYIVFFGQIRYLNIRHERTLTSSPLMLKCSERCRETQEREPAHTGWYLVIQPQKFPRYFEIGS